MNTPNIRFRSFTGDWKKRKLFDCLESVIDFRGRTPKKLGMDWSETGYLALSALNVKDGYIDFSQDVHYGNQELYDRWMTGKELHKGQVLFTTEAPMGNVAQVPDDNKYILSQRTIAFEVNEDIISENFLGVILRSPNVVNDLNMLASGGTAKGVSQKSLESLSFLMPSAVEEQSRIATIFSNLDNLITLHQRKCESLKQVKKYMLQKMFPKQGEKVPEIRFAGFTGDWEQRKFGEWGDFYYGRSCPKWSVTEDATIPCIRYGELYTKFGTKIDRVYSYTNMSPENLRFSKGTEVLIPRVGEDPMDYNHCTWLSLKGVAIGEMISVFNTEQNPLFAATMFNATLQKDFAVRVEGGSVTNLYYEKLKNIDVSFPSLHEQEKIANYFSNIDNLITLHQRKSDSLKEIKKFMLQNMFPRG